MGIWKVGRGGGNRQTIVVCKLEQWANLSAVHAQNFFTRLAIVSAPASLLLLAPLLCWNFKTIYGGQEPRRNRFVVPACQGTQAGGIDSLEPITGLFNSFKFRALLFNIPSATGHSWAHSGQRNQYADGITFYRQTVSPSFQNLCRVGGCCRKQQNY